MDRLQLDLDHSSSHSTLAANTSSNFRTPRFHNLVTGHIFMVKHNRYQHAKFKILRKVPGKTFIYNLFVFLVPSRIRVYLIQSSTIISFEYFRLPKKF